MRRREPRSRVRGRGAARPAWLALCLLLLLAATRAWADTAPPPPDPLRLTRESTQYFQATGDDLDGRIAATRQALETLRGQVSPDQQALLSPLVDELGAALDRYREAVDATPPAPAPAKPFADHYSLRELAQLAQQANAAGLTAQSLKREVERRRGALADAQETYDTLVAGYFRLGDDDPDRLRAGLDVMRAWLAINTGRLELAQRAARATNAEAVAQRLIKETRVAGERLAVDADDVATFAKNEAQASRALAAATQVADALRKQGAPSDKGPGGEIALKRYEHDLLQSDIKIAIAKIEQSQQALLLALAHALVGNADPAAGGDEVAARLGERQRLAADINNALAGWRTTIDQDIAVLNEGLADAEDNDDADVETWRAGLDRARQSADTVARLIVAAERARQINDLADVLAAGRRGWLAVNLEKTKVALAEFVGNANHWATVSLFRLGDTPITLLSLLQVAMTVALAWWLSKFSTKTLRRLGRDHRVNQAVLYTVSRLLRYAILALGVLFGLTLIGFDFTQLAIVTGALSVGIGFGLQAIFNNFVSGLILLFARSIKVGDYIELESGISGQVREIDIRSTRLAAADGVDIVVPNSKFLENSVRNWTLSDQFRRLHVPFTVGYGTDKDLVKRVALTAANGVDWTHRDDPARQPQVWMTRCDESTVEFELVVWLVPAMADQGAAASSAYLWALDDAFVRHGIRRSKSEPDPAAVPPEPTPSTSTGPIASARAASGGSARTMGGA